MAFKLLPPLLYLAFVMRNCLVSPNKQVKGWRRIESQINRLESRLVSELLYTREDIVSGLNDTCFPGITQVQLINQNSDMCKTADGNERSKESNKKLTNIKNTLDYIKDGLHVEWTYTREYGDEVIKQIKNHATSLKDIKERVDSIEQLLVPNNDTDRTLESGVHLLDDTIGTLSSQISKDYSQLKDDIISEVKQLLITQNDLITDKCVNYNTLKDDILREMKQLHNTQNDVRPENSDNYSQLKDALLNEVKLMRSTQKDLAVSLDTVTLAIEAIQQRLVCPVDWTPFKVACYKLFTTKLNWHEAKETCEKAGAHLPELYDIREAIFIGGLVADSGQVWLGGNDIEREGTFVWAHSGSAVTYTNWAPDQPNSFGIDQDCMTAGVESTDRSLWNDLPCLNKRRFVCQIEMKRLL